MNTLDWSRWAARIVPAACLLLTACAPMHHKALSPEAQGRIREVQLQIVLPQESFTFSAASPGVSAALGGGLIPALIDAGVQKSRQETLRAQVEPVLDQLLDADFRSEARAVLAQAATSFPLKVGRADVVALVPTRKEQEQLVARQSSQDAYLRVLMHYALDLESRVLTTRSEISLWQPGQKDASFISSAICQGTALPRDAELLPAVRRQMQEAVLNTVRLAALDLAQPAVQGQRPRQTFTVYPGARSMTGEVLATEARRSFLRTADGTLYSIAR